MWTPSKQVSVDFMEFAQDSLTTAAPRRAQCLTNPLSSAGAAVFCALRIRCRKARVGIGAVDQVDRDERISRRGQKCYRCINVATHAKLSSNTSLGSAQYLLARAQKINRGVNGRSQNGSIVWAARRRRLRVDRCHPLHVTIRCSSAWQSLWRRYLN